MWADCTNTKSDFFGVRKNGMPIRIGVVKDSVDGFWIQELIRLGFYFLYQVYERGIDSVHRRSIANSNTDFLCGDSYRESFKFLDLFFNQL